MTPPASDPSPPSPPARALPAWVAAGTVVAGALELGALIALPPGPARQLVAGALAGGTIGLGAWAWWRLRRAAPPPAAASVSPVKPASQARLAAIARHTQAPVIITDRQGHIEWVNDAFCVLTGHSATEVQGRTPGSFLQGPETDPSAAALMSRSVREGIGFETEILNYRKDGRPYWVLVRIDPLIDEQGNVTGFVGFHTDVTERRRHEALNTSVLAATVYGLISTDAQGLVETCNRGAEALLGRTAGEVVRRAGAASFHDLAELAEHAAHLARELGRPVAAGFEALVAGALAAGGSEEREWHYLRPDGTRVPVRVAVNAMRDRSGRVTGYLFAARDLTVERRQAAAERTFDERLRKIAAHMPGVMFQFKLFPDGRSCFPYVSEGVRGTLSWRDWLDRELDAATAA